MRNVKKCKEGGVGVVDGGIKMSAIRTVRLPVYSVGVHLSVPVLVTPVAVELQPLLLVRREGNAPFNAGKLRHDHAVPLASIQDTPPRAAPPVAPVCLALV